MRTLIFVLIALLISCYPVSKTNGDGDTPIKVASIGNWDCTNGWGYESDRYSLYGVVSLPDYGLISKRCFTEDHKYGFLIEENGAVVFVAVFGKDPTYMGLSEKNETYAALKINEGIWVEILTDSWLVGSYLLYDTAGDITLKLVDANKNTFVPVATRNVRRIKALKFVIPDFKKLKIETSCEKNGLYIKGYKDEENKQGVVLIGENSKNLFMLIFRSNPSATKVFRKQPDGQWVETSENDIPWKFTAMVMNCAQKQKRPR